MTLAVRMDPKSMREAADSAARLLKALANPARLALMCELSQRELCVGELEEATEIAQPTLSQQLGVLREEALVETRREGKQIYYRISSPPALAVLKVLYDQYCSPRRSRS